MGLFSRLFQKTPQPISDPVVLYRQLYDAAHRGDGDALLELCRTNRDTIVANFSNWSNIRNYPGIDPHDAARVQPILHAMGKIADTFRNHFNDPSLAKSLAQPPDDGHTARFNEALAKVKSQVADMRYDEAAKTLRSFLAATENLKGPVVDTHRASAYGMVGLYLLHANRAAEAIAPFQKSLEYCVALNDKQATYAYLQQLYDAHRYLGQPDRAASYADRLAAISAGTIDEKGWRFRADLVRNGEPLLRMQAVQGERAFELPEVDGISGAITFIFQRNRPTLDLSRHLVASADKLALEGKYDEALALYHTAAQADPYDPTPHYRAGMTLLLLQRYAEAIESYQITNTLAPGWFSVVSELWVANELLTGRLSHEAFLVLWAVENSEMEATEMLRLIDQVLPQFPELPHLHYNRGIALVALNRKEEALAAFDAGLSLNPEPDIQSRLLSRRAVHSDPAIQRQLFQQILEIPAANIMTRATAQLMVARLPA